MMAENTEIMDTVTELDAEPGKKSRRRTRKNTVREQTKIITEERDIETESIDTSVEFAESVTSYSDVTEPNTESFSEEITFQTGDVFETDLILLYSSSVAPKHFRGIKGKFYIWDDKVVNDRIRLTDSQSGVGKVERIIGWIKVSDIR